MVRRMSSREARANFADLIGSVHYTREPVIVEKNGKPVAVVISPEQFDAQERARERAWAAIDEIRAENAHLDPDEVYREITDIVEDVRRETREERELATHAAQ